MIGSNISRYRILGQVGEGGMGVVYVAEDTVLGRRVAVKIPHAGRDESHYRARFLREARAVSKLRHENIAAVHDYGETEEGQPFIVMELVSGQTLGEMLAGPGISVARAVEVTCEVARALSEAHRLGVVHRDVKPSNVVIDDAGTVKVLDFGLAKQLHEEAAGGNGGTEAQTLLTARTRSDVVIGTPLYLSPEQARGAKVDGRSDLFALGALLYECLTGRPAFSGANVIEIGAQVLHFDPPPPSKLNPRVPSELDRLTLKALAKKPEDRFQTADEFAAELTRVRSRLPASDTVPTRRLAGADYGHRSSALITMAEGLRRPKFSPLALLASLAGLGLLIWAVWYLRQPSAHVPGAEVAGLYEQGVNAMREGSYYKASGLLRQATERDTKFALAQARLAESLLEMDFPDRAKDAMIQVSALVPDFSVYPRADALYLEAIRSTLSKDYGGAIRRYEEIVALDPRRPEAHLDLGRAYERNNQVTKALNSYTEATTRDSSYAAAFLRLGTLHARQTNQPGAVDAFERAQRLYAERGNKEGEAAVRYQRGRLFAGLKKEPEARAEFNEALRLAVETGNVYQQVQSLLQLATVEEGAEQARSRANEGVRLAQSNGMNDQLSNGYVTLGAVQLKYGDLDGAEDYFNRALQIASNYKLKRYEALAYLNLASVSGQRGKADEADELLAKARDFFIEGGYRREADSCTIALARSKKQRGDNEGSLQLLKEQLRLAEQTGDPAQIASLHQECGAVLNNQEKYAEALAHFRESVSTFRSLRIQSLLPYSQVSLAGALWALGRYEEAEKILNEMAAADPQTLSGGKNMLATLYLNRADLELSRQRFPEAAAQAREAAGVLRGVEGERKDMLLAWADSDLAMAESFAGAHASARPLSQEAVRLASQGRDDWTTMYAHYALALALLKAGDGAGARAPAERALDIATRLGRADTQWRALALAGKASRLAGDQDAARDYLDRAAATLAQFEQSLGAEAAGYLSRPDIQWLRGELGAPAASAAR
ncbi:MAG: tetratricopeptide repeat protein [Acidobacteria bacterium]|nr:tetratricopeptide repeat protein [Acidobacteriota bacterium]